jgi:hypothetical protein
MVTAKPKPAKPLRIATSNTPDKKPDSARNFMKNITAHITTRTGTANKQRAVKATFKTDLQSAQVKVLGTHAVASVLTIEFPAQTGHRVGTLERTGIG